MNRFRYSKNILGAITVLLVICATFFSGIAIAAPATAPISSACTVEEKEPQVIVEPSGEVDIIPPNVIFNKVGECAFTTLKPIKLRELLPNIPEVRAIRIDRAIVQLPPGETVVVKNLQINQIDDEGGKTVIYGCSNLKVNNGTDLNVSCGGASYLPLDKSLQYSASIADFKPGTSFAIKLVASKSTRPDL